MACDYAKVDLLSKLLRELEADIGTRDLTELVLLSLIDSFNSLKKGENSCEFCTNYKKLVDVLTKTEPKFGILNTHFIKLYKYIEKDICDGKKCSSKWKHLSIKKILEMIKMGNQQKSAILKNSESIDVEGKTILIHDHSHTVQDILVNYKKKGKKFRVIIAEQDFEKTYDNIETLHKAGIPFQVIPSYMLSHVHDQIDMAFFGAVTLKSTMNFVMAPGTHGIISEFHVINTPIYMFIDSKKFSLWKAKKKLSVFMHKHQREHYNKPIIYDRVKYSHDRVPHKLFKKIVTNQGVYTPLTLKKLFDERLKKYGIDMDL